MDVVLERIGRAFDRLVPSQVRHRVDASLGELNRFGYDPWGASASAARRTLTVMAWLYRHYFRVQTVGIEHIPAGRVLLVGNHSSQLAYDGMVLCAALALEADPPRFLRAMIERFFVQTPMVGVMMTRVGQLTGLPEHALQLLQRDYAVLVFPEGARGGGKVWRDRYRIMGFGHGFLRLAMQARAPIVPFGFVGGEEMCASFSKMTPLARLFGTPYMPLCPTVVPIPLPTKVHIHFGAPLRFEGTGNEADDVIAAHVARVEQSVADLIDRGLESRRAIFW